MELARCTDDAQLPKDDSSQLHDVRYPYVFLTRFAGTPHEALAYAEKGED